MTTDVAPVGFNESQFSSTLRYDSDRPIGQILEQLKYLRAFDANAEKQARFWMLMLLPALLLLAMGFVLTINLSKVFGMILLASGFILGIVAIVRKMSFGKFDLDDRRYELAIGLISLLSHDMAQDEPLSISLDFKAHNHRSKQLRKGKVSYWNVTYFLDPWFQLRGRLLDGTTFKISVIEKQQDRHRTKISASGKTKHKHKTKNSSEAIVSVKVKDKRYQLDASNPNALMKELRQLNELPAWVQPKQFNADGNTLTLRTTTSHRWNAIEPGQKRAQYDGVQWMAMSLTAVYQQLQPVSK